MLIILHFHSHLFSLAQYEYFIEIVIVPCTHLFNHATLWIHPFTPTPLLAKYWDAIKAVRLFSVWSKLLITVATVSWITLLKAFIKYLQCLLIQISNHGYATVKKERMLLLGHISSKTRQQQPSVENVYIQSTFQSVFWFFNCWIFQTFLSVASSSSHHSQQLRQSWWG